MKTLLFSLIFKESRWGQGEGQELSEHGPVLVNPLVAGGRKEGNYNIAD